MPNELSAFKSMNKNYYKLWDNLEEYGEYFFKIATGEFPEMYSSLALCDILKKIYRRRMKFLDVGCGGGHFLRSLRDRIDEDIDYLGVDRTKRYIDYARKAFRHDELFRVGDIFNLPFDDKTFDVVIATNIILHLPPNPLRAVAELIRVSKKYTIIRTVLGERNYIIQEVRSKRELHQGSDGNKELFLEDGTPLLFNYFNMYTHSYMKSMIKKILPSAKIEIVTDKSFKNFDNRKLTTKTGTKVINGVQVSGNLLLDWNFIIITK